MITTMRKTLFMLAAMALMLVGCKEKGNIPNPGDNANNLPNKEVETLDVDDDADLIKELEAKGIKTITVAQALEIGSTLANQAYTSEWYYVKGIVTTAPTWGSRDGKNHATMRIADDVQDIKTFYCYQVYGENGNGWPQQGFGLNKGNVVVIRCQIKKYGADVENHYDAYVYASTFHIKTVGNGTKENPYLPSDVVALHGTKTGNAYVRGYIIGAAADETKDFSPSNIGVNPETGIYRASNIVIADTKEVAEQEKMIPVQLLSTASYKATRDALKLNEHPENIGKEVVLYGSLKCIDTFLKGAPCLTEVTEYTIK